MKGLKKKREDERKKGSRVGKDRWTDGWMDG